MLSHFQNLLRSLRGTEPSSVLLRSVILFVAADIFFTGFASAFAFTQHGVLGVLGLIATQQTLSAVGYSTCFYWMRGDTERPLQLQRWGVTGMFLSMALAGASPWPAVSLVLLGTLGGLSRGTAWSARTWMELHHTKGAGRQAYLALSESGGTLLKLAGPLVSAGILFAFHDSFRALFVTAGSLGLAALWALPRTRLQTPVPDVIRPLEPWSRAEYWRTAPFYAVDGFGHALRNALFVSGAMAIVGSAARYGLVETLSSILAAGFLALQAGRAKSEPSLHRLKWSLLLLASGWLCLVGALHLPILLPAFIAAYAIGNPLVTVVKNGLTLKGLAGAGGTPQDNAIARIWLLLAARLSALGISAILVTVAVDPRLGLALVVGLALALMPFEYLYAKRLAQATSQS